MLAMEGVMKKYSLAILAAFAASPAVAADLVEAPPAPVIEEVAPFDWTGGYLGIHKGLTWMNGDVRFQGDKASDDFNGFMIGKFVGYNYSFDNVVVGIEGDISYNWNDNRYHAFGTRGDIGTTWEGSLRGRLGYAMDRTLIYATGGWAAAAAEVDTPNGDGDRTFSGWTLGAGVDWAVTDNVFVRGEYRFTDYGSKNIKGLKVDFDQHRAIFGVAYKF